MCSPIWRACVSDLNVFLEKENVSCLSRLAGSPRSRGGRVAQPTSGSVEADSPHLHQTAALFWHGSENWPWWSLMSEGYAEELRLQHSLLLSCSPPVWKKVCVYWEQSQMWGKSFLQEVSCCNDQIFEGSLVLNLNLEHLPKILERWHRLFVYLFICL